MATVMLTARHLMCKLNCLIIMETITSTARHLMCKLSSPHTRWITIITATATDSFSWLLSSNPTDSLKW